MLSSTIFTIGTALNRAHDSAVGVEVLVDGHWLHGDVNSVDGHGVVLHCSDGGLAVIRVERIDVVLVRHVEAFEGQASVAPDDAHPMPAPVTDRSPGDAHLVRPRPSSEAQDTRQHHVVR